MRGPKCPYPENNPRTFGNAKLVVKDIVASQHEFLCDAATVSLYKDPHGATADSQQILFRCLAVAQQTRNKKVTEQDETAMRSVSDETARTILGRRIAAVPQSLPNRNKNGYLYIKCE